MHHLNIEIKAQSEHTEVIRKKLEELSASFKGTDYQKDTYFNCTEGRLKLREGNIENHLIHYFRPNQEGPKKSEVTLFKSDPESSLKLLLTKALGVLTVVEKKRGIYYIDNVKFHIDLVTDLGSFVEIEAIDSTGTIGAFQLMKQCNHYIDLFGIADKDLVAHSYSDMLLNKG